MGLFKHSTNLTFSVLLDFIHAMKRNEMKNRHEFSATVSLSQTKLGVPYLV